MATRAWWAKRWLVAVDEIALDPLPVRHGRALARAGAVGEVAVEPGRLRAAVRDRDGARFVASWALPPLTGPQWETVRSALAERPAHWAALLDGHIAPGLVVDLEVAGVVLLPGAAGLEPDCDCGEFEVPCRHAAAVAVAFADACGADPWSLLAWRGRDRSDLVRADAGRRARRLLDAVGCGPVR